MLIHNFLALIHPTCVDPTTDVLPDPDPGLQLFGVICTHKYRLYIRDMGEFA